MAQQTFALMTTKGRAKEAAALASGTSINISHIAIGSGETVPSGGETKLYREALRKAISGNGLVAGSENTAYFDIFLSASEGPFTIREAGLLDDEGDLIAIACYDPPINKPVPTSGQTVEGIIRIEVAFSNIANITIKVDPSLNVPLQRLTTTPWVPVKAIDLATPPTNPDIGDSYIIGSNSTGVWAAQEGNLTEFTQAGWAIIATPDGHGVGQPDGRVFTKVNGQYIELLASQNYVANYRIPSRQLLNPPFVAVKGINISAPPAQLAIGDTYLVPANATGLWASKAGQLAEWNGSNWLFTVTPNGHGIGLPDGRVFTKVEGSYIEKIALDSQSGKWNYAEAGGTANELTATLNPKALVLPVGMILQLKILNTNTGSATLNINDLGAKPIFNIQGQALAAADLIAGSIIQLVHSRGAFVMTSSPSLIEAGGVSIFKKPGAFNWTFPAGVGRVWAEVYGAGGGAALYRDTPDPAQFEGEGGGGGGYAAGWVYRPPSGVISGYIGSAGNCTFSIGATAESGGTSSFGGISATGGSGANAFGAPGDGGYGVNGLINLAGQAGGDGSSNTYQFIGFGGDAAGPHGGKGSQSVAASWPGGGAMMAWHGTGHTIGEAAHGGVILSW